MKINFTNNYFFLKLNFKCVNANILSTLAIKKISLNNSKACYLKKKTIFACLLAFKKLVLKKILNKKIKIVVNGRNETGLSAYIEFLLSTNFI